MGDTTDGTGRLRILAVDDEYIIAMDVQYVLEPYDLFHVEVETTPNLEKALTGSDQFDVVVVDPGPFEMTRQALMQRIKAHGASVIWSTLELQAPEAELNADEVPVLVKPISSKELLKALVRALEPAQPGKARAVAALLAASGP